MGIGVKRQRNLGVAEDFLYDLGVLPLLQHKRGEGMPEVVEPYPLQACTPQ